MSGRPPGPVHGPEPAAAGKQELLDALAADDPRAQRSRADLRRIHRAMATLPILLRALDRGTEGVVPRSLLELGAGDGSLMLRVAQRAATLAGRPRHPAGPAESGRAAHARRLREAGWTPRLMAMDVFDWLEDATPRAGMSSSPICSSITSRHCAAETACGNRGAHSVFVCCEPRRSAWRSREATWSACWAPVP